MAFFFSRYLSIMAGCVQVCGSFTFLVLENGGNGFGLLWVVRVCCWVSMDGVEKHLLVKDWESRKKGGQEEEQRC